MCVDIILHCLYLNVRPRLIQTVYDSYYPSKQQHKCLYVVSLFDTMPYWKETLVYNTSTDIIFYEWLCKA